MKKETNYIVEVIDRDSMETIMEHYTDTLAKADEVALAVGQGEGYFTIVKASRKRMAELELAGVI